MLRFITPSEKAKEKDTTSSSKENFIRCSSRNSGHHDFCGALRSQNGMTKVAQPPPSRRRPCDPRDREKVPEMSAAEKSDRPMKSSSHLHNEGHLVARTFQECLAVWARVGGALRHLNGSSLLAW
mmetsp:Transcript_250/g.609  ORF Transcript_250/g.609 Transcript_250/m.609 type:complete len:125 (-) Transcript_250:41-415(-)